MRMGKDLGCIKTVKIEREYLNSTVWKQGILFFWDQNSTASTSYIGVYPGGTIKGTDIDSLEQFGAPSTWQIIRTGPNAEIEAVLHHEVLHALGFHHEHNRPDRDQYLLFENEQLDTNYRKMNTTEWVETKYPFEMQSVMIYIKSEKFTKKNGEPVTKTSSRLTTTDALEVQDFYCSKQPKFELKEHVMCSKEDELGFFRPVFVDRLCDGIIDCHDESDEDESRFKCGKISGCCEGYHLWDETDSGQKLINKYEKVDLFEDRPYYNGFNQITHQMETLFCIKNDNGNDRWLIVENPQTIINSKGMLGFKEAFSSTNCPPVGVTWSGNENNRQFKLECFHKRRGVNYCDKSFCDINAHCINLLNDYKCECNYGFTGDGKICTEIPEVNECATKQHDCSKNAFCVDQRFGYTCVCEHGFIDRNSAKPGRGCESQKPPNGCCEKFQMFSHGNYTKNELMISCSIKDYTTFLYSPIRQSYICEIEESLLTKDKDKTIGTRINFAEITRLYIEYIGDHWILVDRDENMNLIQKYDFGSEPSDETVSENLCFPTDLSEDNDDLPESSDEETNNSYTRCIHKIDPQ